MVIANTRTVISGTEVDIGKKQKGEKTEHQKKKTIQGRFGGFECASETVRDHVPSILGTDFLQYIKTAGKKRK